MRTLLIIPIAIALAVGIGYAICAAMHVNPHVREMMFAAVVCLIASVGAMIPIIRTRGASQASVVQSALVGTMIHLFVCCGLGGALIITKAFGLTNAFAYWLLGLYWVTLIVVVVGLIGAIKAANVGAGSPRPAN
jgi:hypothetical protein